MQSLKDTNHPQTKTGLVKQRKDSKHLPRFHVPPEEPPRKAPERSAGKWPRPGQARPGRGAAAAASRASRCRRARGSALPKERGRRPEEPRDSARARSPHRSPTHRPRSGRAARTPSPGAPSPPVPPSAISGRRQFKKRAAALTSPPIGCRPHRPAVSRPLIRHGREMPRSLALPFRQHCALVAFGLVAAPATQAECAPIGFEMFPGQTHSACCDTDRRLLSGRGGRPLC